MSDTPRVIIVGMFGQSGCGKTSIIQRLNPSSFEGFNLHIMPNVIRSIFADKGYINGIPLQAPSDVSALIGDTTGDALSIMVDAYISSYIASQMRLVYQYFTKVKEYADGLTEDTVLITDRSPLDFYAYTKSAVKYISNGMYDLSRYDGEILKIKALVEKYLNELCDLIMFIGPHGGEIEHVQMEARILGLYPEFQGENWYGAPSDLEYPVTINCLIESTDVDTRIMEVTHAINRYISVLG